MSLFKKFRGKSKGENVKFSEVEDKKAKSEAEITETVLRQPEKATPITKEKERAERTALEIAEKKDWEVKSLPVWKSGDVILDTYEVEDVISGGMGHVYIANHKNWKVKLAIKSPNEMMLSERDLFARILREANSWTELGLHPNIAYCYYVRNIEDVPHIFVEYVGGGDLKTWIEEGKCLDYKDNLDLAIQFCHGMEFAHSKGMIHRDIKPANVLMTREGILKITDFGLVRSDYFKEESIDSKQIAPEIKDDKLTSLGEMGTPGYYSPEQFANPHEVDERTDIFAFGVCLYEMFCGNRPYEITFGPKQEPPDPVSLSGDTNFPSDIGAVLTKSVQWDPSERYKSFNEIRQELLRIYQLLFGEESPYAELELLDLEADGLNNQGVSYFDLGRKEDAISCWKKALEINQLHPETTYNLSLILWRDGKIADDEVMKRFDNCRKNPAVDKEKIAELKSFIHAERVDFNGARFVLKGFPGRYELYFTGKDFGQIESVKSIEGHTNWVYSVAFSSNGSNIISGSEDKTVRLWDLASGRCVHTFEGHTGVVGSVALTPDGRHAVSGSYDKTVRVWELKSGRCVQTLEGHTGSVLSVALSPDGRYAVLGMGRYDKTVKVWELKSGRCVQTLEGHTGSVLSVALSPDGRYVVSGSWDKTIRVWDFVSSRCIHTLEGHTEGIKSVALSPDGRYVVSGSDDLTVRVWDLASGCCSRTMEGHTKEINSVAVSRDGRYVVSGSYDKTVRVWDLASGRCIHTLEGHTEGVKSVALSPDGRHAVSGSVDKTLRVWKIISGIPYTADLRLALLKGYKERKKEEDALDQAIIRVKTFYEEGNYKNSFSVLYEARKDTGFSDNDFLNRLYSKLMKKGRLKGLNFSFQKSLLKGHTEWIRSVAISPDGRYAVSGSGDKTLRVWELNSGSCARILEGHTRNVNSVAISPDGRCVVSGSDDKTVRVWELISGQCAHTVEGHSTKVTSVAISPDGRHAVSGSTDDTVRVWDLASGLCVLTLKVQMGRIGYIESVTLTPDGRYALLGCSDKTLRMWELASGSCVRILEGHTRYVNSVAISPDGQYAVSGSDDKSLRMWELASGKCFHTLEGHTKGAQSVAISPDGRYVVSGSKDNTVREWELIWDLEFPNPVDWDEGVRPYLEIFLTLHNGKWNEHDFQTLISELAKKRGYGWVRPEGIRKEIEKMTKEFASNETKEFNNGPKGSFTKKEISLSTSYRSLEGHASEILSVAITCQGKHVVSGSHDKTLKVWALETGSCLRTYQGHTYPVNSVAVTPNAKYIVSGGNDKTLKIWDFDSGRCLKTLEGHSGYVISLATTPDGKYVISGSQDRTIKIWDLKKGTCLRTFEGHKSDVKAVTITPDGRCAISGHRDKTLKVWDLETGVCLRTLEGHTGWVRSVDATPDGIHAVSGSDDKSLKLWELETGRCLRSFEGHSKFVLSVAVTPDGRHAISGGYDNTLRLWELETGRCLKTIKDNKGVPAIAISPDSKLIVSGSYGKTMKVWNLDG